MRFVELGLQRYGAFSDRALRFRPDAHLHVVLGANEAGKTTALSAIGDLLFGVEERTRYGFRHGMSNLWLTANLSFADGRALALRRRKGRKNTLFDSHDKPLPEDALAFALGAVTREVFEQEFGLDSARLRKGGEALLAADGRLAETLAAGSSGLSALNGLRQQFEDEAIKRFTTRRADKPFYHAVDAYNDAQARLREAIVSADTLAQAQATREQAGAQRLALEAEHEETSRQIARLERARRTRVKLAELAQAEAALLALSTLPAVGVDTLAQWRQAHDARRVAADLLTQQVARRDANAQAQKALRARPDLMEAASLIEGLRERLGDDDSKRTDLPKREQSARQARAELDAAARRLGLADADALLERAPTAPALARARALAQAQTRRADRRADAERRLQDAQRRRAELESAHGAGAVVDDPADLARALEALAPLRDDIDQARRDDAAIAQAHDALVAQTRRLHPAVESPQALARLPLPAPLAIEASARVLAAQDEAARQAQRDLARIDDERARIEQEIAGLARAGVLSTREERDAHRRERDEIIAALERETDAQQRASGFERLRLAVAKADALADALLGDAQRVAQRQALTDRREDTLRERATLAQRHEEVMRDQARAHEEWRALWRPAGIEPSSPEAMRRWREQAGAIIEGFDAQSQARARLAALRARIDGWRPALAQALSRLGLTAGADSAPDAWLRLAAKTLAARQAAWSAQREQGVRLDAARRDCRDIAAEIERIDCDAAAAQADWAQAMTDISACADASRAVTLAEAEAALAIWDDALAHQRELRDSEARASAIRHDIEAFADHLDALCARFDVTLAQQPPRRIVEALSAQFKDAERAEQESRRLTQEAAALEQAISQTQAQAAQAQRVLMQAAQALACDPASDMSAALADLETRQSLLVRCAALHEDMIAIGDGRTAQTLRDEQADIDLDGLEGALSRLRAQEAALREAIKNAVVQASDAARAYDTLCAGRDAPRFAQAREEAAAEIVDVADDWLLRAAAADLARRAIDLHRARAQDSVMARIGALFSLATAGAFTGLRVEYGDDDQPAFVCQRADGGATSIGGLSEGTRDQLFLALRLALLEARGGEPLPFIGDDLLTSFDDQRTEEALALLADFGRARQTILFTHHAHVAAMAQERLGERVDVLRLD